MQPFWGGRCFTIEADSLPAEGRADSRPIGMIAYNRIDVSNHNLRAQRAYEKAGFRREGVMRQSDWVDGRWVDAVIYGVLEDEFREQPAGGSAR